MATRLERWTYRVAAAVARAVDAQESRVQYTVRLGDVLQRTGKADEAKNAYSEALRVSSEADNPLAVGLARNRLGYLAYRAGDFPAALREFEAGLQVVTQLDRVPAELGTSLLAVGNALLKLGYPVKARATYERALTVSLAGGQTHNAAAAAFNLGGIAMDRREPEQAEARLRQAAQLYDRLRGRSARRKRADALVLLAAVLAWPPRRPEAATAYRTALDQAVASQYLPAQAKSLLGLAAIAAEDGDMAKRDQLLGKAARIADAIEDEELHDFIASQIERVRTSAVVM